ncbi:hypothetical protein FRUB_06698 [Fimbriiglobus ruber]|uniref:Uncharacterized protein n=2 Tax=Fimbriiglobus ruber TaxID=1908690 RepID=A0A225DGC8_9BACT|nr:hypothetical protein FRUB_06698 [Fimbriiglobus ruber]
MPRPAPEEHPLPAGAVRRLGTTWLEAHGYLIDLAFAAGGAWLVEPCRLGAFFAFIALKPPFWDGRVSAIAGSWRMWAFFAFIALKPPFWDQRVAPAPQ